MPTAEYLTLKEVADLLRLKERKLYDLVHSGRIPCVKVTGKWLFPRQKLDAWMAAGGSVEEDGPDPADGPPALPRPVPAIVAGSRDPWLDWCIGQSGCGLATAGGGSGAGLAQLLAGQALAAGIHLLHAGTAAYNVPFLAGRPGSGDMVLIEWAKREQGLVVAPGNPLGLSDAADLARGRVRVARRQAGAGAQLLLEALLARTDHTPADLTFLEETCPTGFEVGMAILDGRADAGLATRAVARRLHLDFVPLAWERFDLALRRRDWFEPPMQTLAGFCRSDAAHAKAADLLGYDLSGHGTVWWNG